MQGVACGSAPWWLTEQQHQKSPRRQTTALHEEPELQGLSSFLTNCGDNKHNHEGTELLYYDDRDH